MTKHFHSALDVVRVGSNRLVLAAGFGGLLLLMAFGGVDAVQTLRRIQLSNDAIRDDFVLRTRMLERIRGDLYISGTYVRDYLLEPDPGRAEGHRLSLLETRSDMDAALRQYRNLLTPQEAKPFQGLTGELAAYWKVLEPVFGWSAGRRKRDGYGFLRDEVFRRRMSMLAIADRIASMNELQLDAGKVKVESTFLQFRRRLATTIVLTIAVGIALAVFTSRRILVLEANTAGHYQQIAKAQAELKQLSARLVQAQENERRSIARELHDEVGQAMTGILLEMANLSTLARTGDARAVESKAAEIKKLLESSIRVVRNMALLLRPSMLDDLGLVPALEWQAKEISKRGGIHVKIVAGQVSEDLPEDHKTCVYRIVQEALHNIVQHAEARNAKVTVRQDAGRLLLSIEDDGKGFDAGRERGMGLLGIQERVGYLGGSFAVESQSQQGTVLRAELPLPGRPDHVIREIA
jgi:signal transduction histidine kinase